MMLKSYMSSLSGFFFFLSLQIFMQDSERFIEDSGSHTIFAVFAVRKHLSLILFRMWVSQSPSWGMRKQEEDLGGSGWHFTCCAKTISHLWDGESRIKYAQTTSWCPVILWIGDFLPSVLIALSFNAPFSHILWFFSHIFYFPHVLFSKAVNVTTSVFQPYIHSVVFIFLLRFLELKYGKAVLRKDPVFRFV